MLHLTARRPTDLCHQIDKPERSHPGLTDGLTCVLFLSYFNRYAAGSWRTSTSDKGSDGAAH